MEKIGQTIKRLKNQSSEITPSNPINTDYYQLIKKAMVRTWTNDPFKKTKELIITPALDNILINLGKYLAHEPGKYNANLGFIIMGGVGTGKSLLLTALKTIMCWRANKEGSIGKIKWATARSLSTFFRRSDWDSISNFEDAYELFIDDVGTENPFLLVYGNKEYPISEILYARHEKKRRTYFTTNLDWSGIKELYDDQDGRIMDRIKSNSNVIVLDGKSWRN